MDGGKKEERYEEQTGERQKTPPKVETVAADARQQQQHPPPQKCPRCESSNTKFCYYNNYSLTQPRYFCKSCRRYWTHGGSLRNVPIGGGSRKAKRPRIAAAAFANSEIPCSTPEIPSMTGIITGQSVRPMPPAIGNTFYSDGGGFLTGFGGVQSLQGGGRMNDGPTVSYGGGPCRFAANLSILQGMGLPGYRNMPPPHPQLQFNAPASDQGYPSQQSFNTWVHPPMLHIAGGCSGASASGSASAACCNPSAGSDPTGSSFSQNQWPESDPGFNPSQ